MKAGRRKGGAAIPAVIDTGRRKRSNVAQPVYNSTTGRVKGGAAENVIAITDRDLVQNGGQYKLMGGAPLPMRIVTGRRRLQGAAQVVYPVDINGGYDWTFASVYLLRDEFTTNLAAGSVNGTAAEPGPGTRVVVDTDAPNRLSIAGGALSVVSNAAPAWGDPGLWYDAVARAAGRLILGSVSIGTTIKILGFGFDTNQTASLAGNAFTFNSDGTILTRDTGVGIVIGNYAAAVYSLCLVIRGTGAFYFISGGAFANWTLLYVSAIDNTATIYPGIVNYSSNFTADYIRIPDQLWIPVPLLSDSFNRANGAMGNTDGAGHAEANGGGGVAWVDRVGTTQIAANTASASALVGTIAIANVDAGNINVLHEAELTRVGNVVGIVLRYADASNYVYAGHDGTNAFLIKRIADVETPLLLVVTAYAAGAVCRVICEGTSFSLYYNNVKIGATQVIADAGLQTGTECGLYSSNVGNSQDDMVTWARNMGYAELDGF